MEINNDTLLPGGGKTVGPEIDWYSKFKTNLREVGRPNLLEQNHFSPTYPLRSPFNRPKNQGRNSSALCFSTPSNITVILFLYCCPTIQLEVVIDKTKSQIESRYMRVKSY